MSYYKGKVNCNIHATMYPSYLFLEWREFLQASVDRENAVKFAKGVDCTIADYKVILHGLCTLT
jgi:hypothetical protein